MTATVRLYAHMGLVAAPATSARQTLDSVHLLTQPYRAREVLTPDTSTPAASTPATLAGDNKSGVLLVQVQEGKAVHFEVNNGNRAVTADSSSPILRGDNVLQWGEGFYLSVLEAS